MSTGTVTTNWLSRRTLLRAAGAGLAVGSVGSGKAVAQESDQDTQENFVAMVSPDNAVPADGNYQPYPGENARGMGVFTLVGDAVVEYTVMLANVSEVTGVHIHQGGADENGPHLAELFNGGPTEQITGLFLRHRLSAEDTCTSDPPGDNCLNEGFEPLMSAVRAGDTYLQVHIGNEVLRGQIR